MERFIKDPTGLTAKDLENYDWDVIRTNITIDASTLNKWANEVINSNKGAMFDWQQTHLLNEKFRPKIKEYIDAGLIWGYPKQWTFQWSVQRYDALPNPFICDPNIYPEVTSETFNNDINNDLEQYQYGYFKKIKDTLNKSESEPDCYKETRMVLFGKDEGVSPHYDVVDGKFLVRMHIQVNAHSDAIWTFGENQDREYRIMETGRIFLVNSAVYHSAINRGNEPWLIIHNNPSDDAITRVLNTTLHIDP